jgi:outer membrane protein OmpA-like peptidoglycan-associated protein
MEVAMADTLLGSLRKMMTPAAVARLSSAYADPVPAVEKGLSGAIAVVLGALTARAGNKDLMAELLAFTRDPAVAEAPGDPQVRREFMLAPAAEGVESRFQALFLGPGSSGLVTALAGHANLSRSTASSLIGQASSMVLGQLARVVRRDNLDVASLGARLAGEESAVRRALPPELAVLPVLRSVPERAAAAMSREADLDDPVGIPGRARPSTSWLFPALFAGAALLALVLLLRARDLDERSAPSRTAEAGAVGTGGTITRVLPGGAELSFARAGTEARFLEYVERAPAADTERWFEFDAVGFEPGSARLRADSQAQLSNVAAILKAYPAVHVKVGGYTDDSGDAAVNRRLSQERADAVANELRRLGVAGNRLDAEGYGDRHPIADNSSADRRARNRRVAITVTSR